MTAREYLEQPKLLREELRSDLDNLASLRSIVEKSTATLSFTAGCKASKDNSLFEDTVIDIAAEEERIRQKARALARLELEVLRTISCLSGQQKKELLRLRYLEEMKWSDIARKLYLSKNHVYAVHREALAELENFIVDRSQS